MNTTCTQVATRTQDYRVFGYSAMPVGLLEAHSVAKSLFLGLGWELAATSTAAYSSQHACHISANSRRKLPCDYVDILPAI